MRCQDPKVASLQAHVLRGDWDGAAACLGALQLNPPSLAAVAQFLLRECKYLEVSLFISFTALHTF